MSLAGEELPDSIKNAPRLWEGNELYYQAFWMLSSCRKVMDGVVGEIPWTAMKLYADEYEFDTEQRDFLYVLCSEMDTTFCKIVNKKE